MEIERLRKKVKELLTPEFDTKGCTFSGKLPLTIRGRESATIYCNVREESVAPTLESFDRCCATPMVLLLEHSQVRVCVSRSADLLTPSPHLCCLGCQVVTVASSLDGEEVSESRRLGHSSTNHH